MTCIKKITLGVFLICISSLVWGQEDKGMQRYVYLELAGSGGIGSFNYEKAFYKKNTMTLTWRLGLSFAPIDKNNGTAIVFPVMIQSILGETKHKLELGVGQGISITTKGSPFALTIASVGYRHQSEAKRFFYRIMYTPLMSYLVDVQFQHWAGASVGLTINTPSR